MGDSIPIRTLEDYSRPSHEGYSNTIELPEVNNVRPGKFQNEKPEEEQEEKDNPKNLNTKSSSPPDPSVSFIIKKVRNFTYITNFMIVEDISSIVDPRLSQVVLGNPFVEISNMTQDPPEGVARFTNGTNEIAYKMPHKIEQYNSLSDLEKEHTKFVYFMNQEDKKRRVDYVMSKILGFYKECLELGPEYLTGITDEGEVT
nr:protein kinase-like domain, concanavalin A-like lectin/glucanase domain protein [Tanacetum cinerariifolium]